MEKNIGTIDKLVRVSIAIALAGVGYAYGLWVLYIVALVPLATAATGFCPLYKPLKINTT